MIYCECNNDEALLKALGKTRKQIKHKPNKFEACKFLRKDNNSIALIDGDIGKLQDNYADKLKEAEKIENDFAVREDFENSNKVIILYPDLEGWVEKAIIQSGIEKKKYSLPEDLHDIGTNDKKLERFKQLLLDALNKSQMLKALKKQL